MSISVIHNNYYAQFVSVHFLIQENIAWGLMFAVCLKRDSKSIFFATTTTIHISGLIKVTATITPIDSESNNYVYDKVKTPGSSTQALQLLKLGKSTNKNYENIILMVKHGMNLIFLFCFA